MSVEILTFGCRLNAYESELIAKQAGAAGLDDAVIVNTCAVTAEAERQARQAIRKARRAHPGAQLIVTGCAAQIAPEKWAAMPEVDRVIGNAEKLDRATYAPAPQVPLAQPERGMDAFGHEKIAVNDIFAARETAAHLVGGFEGRARAFVQVQNGCDHRCTFCIIPYGRGNSRSVPMGPIVDQVRSLVAAGYAEIVLTGVDITSFGADLPGRPSLGAMAARLLKAVPELKRLRLTSLDPVEIDADLWRLLAEEERLMPHLHLSIQAGDDLVLKRMKRRHLRADAIAACAKARALRPDTAFGADLIAGFPTETEAMFANTLALVEECGLAYLHVFPYSARPGTPAAKMPQVPVPERRDRARRLREAGAASLARFLATQAGRSVSALVEEPGRGRTEHYAPIALPRSLAPGTVLRVRVAAATADSLVAAEIPPFEAAA
ncbi:MAG: tRNA (N(6)-L-threonylcarbamoyladenosine(37)-C(2))-methylthiotransferase MtaB [Rhodospirillaceae bacterium]|nr:tRNA (N(6)-L-threonylcarbamoyladenosine(37)-C(2))-methylthiotransferase MtaB [Rhodospirillaceae bacterium]